MHVGGYSYGNWNIVIYIYIHKHIYIHNIYKYKIYQKITIKLIFLQIIIFYIKSYIAWAKY